MNRWVLFNLMVFAFNLSMIAGNHESELTFVALGCSLLGALGTWR